MTAARPIILDCDPGLDDAVALLLALASPQDIELLGVTVVAGNAPLEFCAVNARKICELAGCKDTPVYSGCSRPILKPLVTAPEVHGVTGLAGAGLPPPTMALQAQHAVDFIIDTVKARDGVTLCPIGPLTNIALALIKAPEIAARIREIVLMGGAMHGGNVTPVAEFNFYVDPHAAQGVLSSGIPVVMFGLDVTHTVLVTPERIAALRAIGSRVGTTVANMMAALPQRDAGHYGGCPLHDPCVIAYLIRPDLFSGRDCYVEALTDAGPAQGQSVVDWRGVTGRAANVRVVERADAAGFFRLLNECLTRFTDPIKPG